MKQAETDYKHAYVMLIDDVELDNFINEQTIKSFKFSKNVYITTSGKSALEFLTNLLLIADDYPNVYPEAIFIDINMPVSDGFQFINAFKEITSKHAKKPKLAILTSSVAGKDRQKTEDISQDIVFLNKPLTKEMLDGM